MYEQLISKLTFIFIFGVIGSFCSMAFIEIFIRIRKDSFLELKPNFNSLNQECMSYLFVALLCFSFMFKLIFN